MIFIEEPFKFVFAPNTFADENPLTIWGYWVDPDGEEQKVEKCEWLKFTVDERVFEGLPKEKFFGKSFTFRVCHRWLSHN